LKDESLSQEIMNAAHLTGNFVVFHNFGQICLAYGANGSQKICSGLAASFGPWFSSSQSDFHQFVGQQSSPSSATIGVFPNRIRMHLYKMAANRFQDVSRGFEISGRSGDITGIMIGYFHAIVGRFVNFESASLYQ
jgi:hypothetical protein